MNIKGQLTRKIIYTHIEQLEVDCMRIFLIENKSIFRYSGIDKACGFRESYTRHFVNKSERLNPTAIEVLSSYLTKIRYTKIAKAKRVEIDTVISEVCRHFNLTKELILYGKPNKSEYCIPRQIVIYLARELGGYNYHHIGREVYKDHASCINGHRRVQDMVDTNYTTTYGVNVRGAIGAIKKNLENK
jgi:hypothetical protein